MPTKQYKTKMLLDEIPVFFSPSLAGFVGVNEAIILQKLYYLMQLDNFGKMHSGYKYIRMTTEEWIKELPFLDAGQIKTAIKNLTGDGFLFSTTFTGRSKWYTILQTIEELSEPVERIKLRIEKRKIAAKASVDKRSNDTMEQSVPIECNGTKCSDTMEQSVPIIGTKCSTSNQPSFHPSEPIINGDFENSQFQPLDANYGKLSTLLLSNGLMLNQFTVKDFNEIYDTAKPPENETLYEWYEYALTVASRNNALTLNYVFTVVESIIKSGNLAAHKLKINNAKQYKSQNNGNGNGSQPQPVEFMRAGGGIYL